MKKYYLPFFLAIAIIICFIPKTCERQTLPSNVTKDTINHVKKQADSNKVVVVYKDSIRTRYVTKWKEIRHDSLIPCETKLVHCDTLLLIDSSLIYSLKQAVFLDSIIIGNYQKLSSQDSTKIASLEKDNKRLKKWNKFWRNTSLGQAAINAGRAVVNSINN
jgi:hypothetical protein